MDLNRVFDNSRERLYLPFLSGTYDQFAQPFAWTMLRFALGASLVYEGLPKVMHPLVQMGFVESIGFHPGWFWSPFLALLLFFGGICIFVGFLTRPFALANGVMLLVTIWFHISHPYNVPLLSEAGQAAVQTMPELFTKAGLMRFKDGGMTFLDLLQEKAVMLQIFWAGSAFLYAAFGGGFFSVDRKFMKKQF